MGAIAHEAGVAFRVWAPHADNVDLTGTFNDWSGDRDTMTHEGNGYWYADLEHARSGTSTVTSSTTGRNGSLASTRTRGK